MRDVRIILILNTLLLIALLACAITFGMEFRRIAQQQVTIQERQRLTQLNRIAPLTDGERAEWESLRARLEG